MAFSNGEQTQTSSVTMQFFGDIMLDRHVALNMSKDGLNYVFANLSGQEDRFFMGANMYIANLEGPFAPARVQTSKSIAFRFDPALVTQLKSYGFDAFNLANNHSYDMGKQNVAFTRELLQKNEFGYFGDEYHQGSEYTYFAGQEQGLPFTVAFIGLNATEGEMDMQKVKQAVGDAKRKSKFVVVNIHWGEEYKRNSNAKQQNIAHQLVDWGADAIIGHHPHVIQEAEVYKDKFIFYSLGNFIFDQYFSKETQEGISVGLILEDSGEVKVRVMPFFSKKSQVQIMTGEQKDEFFDWFNKNSRLGDKKIEV
jgi:poly-gamma-glutamate synthesis protein (capsule biosynthesis protein)